MDYATLIRNVVAVQRGLPGVIEALDHEPGGIVDTPTFYNLLDAFEVVQHSAGGKRRIAYRVTMRLCLRYADDADAERQLAGFITPVLDVFDGNKSLTVGGVRGALTSAVAAGSAGYLPINGVTYRILDFILDATTEETVAYR